MTSHGAIIVFGISATATTLSGSMQAVDQSSDSQKETIRNGQGDTIVKVWYDTTETKASFDYVIAGSTVLVPAVGTLITVTDATDAGLAGTTWTVDSWTKTKSNTAAVKCKVELSKNDNITS